MFDNFSSTLFYTIYFTDFKIVRMAIDRCWKKMDQAESITVTSTQIERLLICVEYQFYI